MRYTSLGFFSSQGFQRNIQLARTLAGLNDYLADLERRFIVSGQHPNHILLMLPGGEDRTGLLARPTDRAWWDASAEPAMLTGLRENARRLGYGSLS